MMLLAERAKEQRLTDIRRGKQFFKQIDNLAQQQWLNNQPKQTNIKRRATFGHHDKKEFTYEERFLLKKNASFAHRVQSDLPPSIQRENLRNRPRVQSEYLPYGGIEHGKLDNHLFNQWGCVIQPFSEKVRLEKNENNGVQPFKFRDERKIVSKPIPKKGIPMSRVAHSNDRKLKIHTDFRSNNGVVDVIHPFGPNPEVTEKEMTTLDDQAIQKEQTTLMLKRIDRMLHPEKNNERQKTPDSMHQEGDSELHELSELSILDLEKNFEKYRVRENTTVSEKEQRIKFPTFHVKPSVRKFLSYKEISKNPENIEEMSSMTKCKMWVKRWMFGKPSLRQKSKDVKILTVHR